MKREGGREREGERGREREREISENDSKLLIATITPLTTL